MALLFVPWWQCANDLWFYRCRCTLRERWRSGTEKKTYVCDCCKPMNHCRDWAFRHSGLEAGLPAFQLSMFSKCDGLPKGNLWDMLVGFRNPFPLFFLATTFNSWKYQRVGKGEILRWESQSTSNIVRVEVWCWTSDGFEWFFGENFLYPRFVVLPRPKQLTCMPVTIKLRLGFWGDQPFSCPCSLTVTHCRKKICSTYLFQESMPFGSGMVFPLQNRECWVPYKPQKGMKIVEQKGSYTRNIVGPTKLGKVHRPLSFCRELLLSHWSGVSVLWVCLQNFMWDLCNCLGSTVV